MCDDADSFLLPYTTEMTRSPIELMEWTTKVLRPLRPVTLIAFGSSIMGGFRPRSSDLDLFAVYDDSNTANFTELETALRSLAAEGIDGMLVSTNEISNDRPSAYYPSRNLRRILLPIEIVLIRDHSRVLAGIDCRDRMWNVSYEVASFVSLFYFLDQVKLISEKKAVEESTLPETFAAYCATAVRKLAELRVKRLISKQAAFEWLLKQQSPRRDFKLLQDYARRLNSNEDRDPLGVNELGDFLIGLCIEMLSLLAGSNSAARTGASLSATVEEIKRALRANLPEDLPPWFVPA